MKKAWTAMLLATLLAGCLFSAWAEETPELHSYYFQVTQKAAQLPEKDQFRAMQGGGTDGRYAYYLMTDGEVEGILYKFDLATWECVAVSQPLNVGHGNDIAYDAGNHRLLIAPCMGNKLTCVDPDTLTAMEPQKTLLVVDRLAYLPETNQTLIGSWYTLILYEPDSFIKAARHFTCGSSRYTTQGMTSDGKYIYDVRWDFDHYYESLENSDLVVDFIVIHDLDGHYIGEVPVYGLEGEPENIICLGGNRFAIGCNGSDSVYLAELREAD